MRKYTLIATAVVASFGFNTFAEAAKCNGKVCGPAVEVVCEKIYLDPDIWQQVRLKYSRQGQTATWYARSLVCGGNCITYKRNYSASSYICAPKGSQVCYQDSVTKQKHVWTIDGKEEPAR